MNNLRKTIVKFVLLITVPAMIFLIIDLWPGAYEFKVDGITVGYVDSKAMAKESYNEVIKDISDRFNNIEDIKVRLEFNRIDATSISLSSKDEIKNNINKNLKLEVKAKELTLNKHLIGYIASEEDGKELLNQVAQRYIKILNIKKKDIISIKINTDAQYKDKTIEINKVNSIENLTEEIVKINNKQDMPVAKVEICLKQRGMEVVEPTIKVMSTSDLYIGETKQKNGVQGEKEVIRKVTYLNGKTTKSEVVEEKLIASAKDTILLKGNKNPIGVGVAFLTNPTRSGYITSSYGSRWGGTHHGMDIGASYGEPITAALDGYVEYIGYSDIYGNMIILNHGKGIETVYGHASKVLTKKGDTIKKGDLIAKVGSTGRSTGPHLHFELRYNGVAINPKEYIK